MWSDETQMVADSIFRKLIMMMPFINSIMYNNAFIYSEHDTVHYDQIKGKMMTAWIDSQQNSKSLHIEIERRNTLFSCQKKKTEDSLGNEGRRPATE